MSGKKRVYQSSSNVDTLLLEKFSNLIALEQNDSKILQLHTFIASNGGSSLSKLLHNWSYYATSNDHSSFIDLSVKLSKFTHLVNLGTSHASLSPSFLEIKPIVISFYKDLLTNHAKVVYRALNNNRGPLTNPVLRILNNLVSYHSGCLVEEFVNNFDFNLSVLPKLLVPAGLASGTSSSSSTVASDKTNDSSKDHLSIRYNFLKFWFTLLSNASHFLRKDLLVNNSKIMNNVWKFMAESDSLQTLIMIIDFVDRTVLSESTFKKATKCKILSENFMFKVQQIFNRFDGHQVEEQRLVEFMNKIVSDTKNGLTFVNEKPWNNLSETGSNNTSGSLSINNKNFRLNNKLLYTLLTSLKPWEHTIQLNLVNTILEANVELVPPYMNWIVQSSGGYHDPALSSWWIGHTLLYNNILQLPIPEVSNANELDVKLISENIALAPLSKGALIKGINSENLLIKQFVCQIMVLQLEKVYKIVDKLSSQRQEFVESIFMELPEEAVILAAYKEVTEKKLPDLLKLTLVMILSKYEQLQNTTIAQTTTSSSGLLKYVNGEINTTITSENLSGLDLVMLDSFLAITSQQGGDDQDFKWWNKTNSGHSFFTSLIKLSIKNLNESLIYKNFTILTELTSQSLIFNKDLIVSPIFAIIQAFKDLDGESTIFKLLDETISRAIRTPYKYLDLSHSKYNDLSLFVIVLLEQFKFVFKTESSELEYACAWLFEFLKYLVVIGEPKDSIIELVNQYLTGEQEIPKFKEIVNKKNLMETFEFKEGAEDDLTFLEFMISCKYTEPLNKIPVNKFDITGLLFRLKQTSDEDLIFDLMMKMGNYLLSSIPGDVNMAKFIQSKSFFEDLIVKDENDFTNTKILISEIISEIFQQLPINFRSNNEDFNRHIYKLFTLPITSEKDQVTISKFIWVLSDKQVLELIESTSSVALLTRLCELAVDRSLKISQQVFSQIVAGSSPSILIKIIESNQITFTEESLKSQIDEILALPSSEYLLSAFITTHSDIISYLVEKSDSITDESLLCSIGCAIATERNQSTIDLSPFFKRILNFVLRDFDSAFAGASWIQTLIIFAKSLQLGNLGDISEEIVSKVIDHVKESPRDGFLAEFADFAYSLILSSSSCSLDIEEWLHKSVLYITKKLAISKVISKKFQAFIESMDKLIQLLPTFNNSIWKITPIAILNTQVEVILGHKLWCKQHAFILHYVNSVVTSGLKNIVQSEKLLQIFINNESMILAKDLPSETLFDQRYQSALIISNLYNIDQQRNSTPTVLTKVLLFYLGSIRIDDLILKEILIKIEAKLSSSWVSQVQNWELTEELTNDEIDIVGGEDRLITQEKSGLVVTLNKNFIRNTNEKISFAVDIEDPSKNKEFVPQNYGQTIYDSEFLMMLLINNEEMIKFEKDKPQPVIDVKKLIESNLLQFIVTELSNARVSRILRVILQGILKTLNDSEYVFKDKNIYKVFVSNILNTFRQQDGESDNIPHIIWYLHGAMVPILSNPGHFLYERTFRYVLSHPKIKATHLPMYSSITMALSSDAELEGEDSHFKQVGWLLSSLWYGVNDTKDLNILKFSGAIEWCLNLLNSPFISFRIRFLIFKILYKVQQINEGSDLLITRFGILTSLEQQAQTVEKVGTILSLKIFTADLIEEHVSVNIDELSLRLGISVGSNKRIREWTGDDMKGFVKRIHSETK